jgi:DNA-binding response OmpR family regulator
VTVTDVGAPRVLVAEDDPELRAMLVAFLSEDGYRLSRRPMATAACTST